MKVTIVTVAYNAAETVASTIHSVAAQTYADIEHIVIDGASEDMTVEIAQQASGRISRLVSEPDLGVYDAMNKGLALASGDVIGFLHADDIYAGPAVLSRVMTIMGAEGLDALLGDVEFFKPEDPARTVRRYRSARFTPDRIAWGWMPAHPALFLRRHVYERFGPFRTDYRIAGDFEYCARIFHAKRLVYRSLPETLVRMRVGGISTSGWRSTLLLNQEVLRACRENGISTNIFKISSKYPVKFLEFLVK
ncbi:MAG: glycosyltransferase [Nitrospira sp.]|nr:glycosyltransferase [Nitrospira sp.]